jgi:hypothetical protein
MRSKTPPNGPAAWCGLRAICVHEGQYRKETLICANGTRLTWVVPGRAFSELWGRNSGQHCRELPTITPLS